jgi:sigma-B regulation protein RsbU (phosphoserine phosphatase)
VSWKARGEMFRKMPVSSIATFLAGVGCLFAAVGIINDCLSLEESDTARFIIIVVATAVPSMLWAWFGTVRMIRSMIALFVAQTAVFVAIGYYFPVHRHTLTNQQWRDQVTVHGVWVLLFIVAGYVLFLSFFRLEGKRFFAAHTEIELASGIQRQLVPAIATVSSGFEFYGVSLPSGAVGGDLLDVIPFGNATCAYIADVAGHGVPAGVLMSMIKTAVRMRLTSSNCQGQGLLESVNEVLSPLTDARSYATFAYVLITPEPELTFSLAAHLPLFHFQSRSECLERCTVENLPVAMFPVVKYATGRVLCERGDLLALVTDGITEVFGRDGEEIGYTHIENALRRNAGRTLAEISDEILEATAAYGKITDDRTLLLMRRL